MSATTSPRNLHISALIDSAAELTSVAVDESVFDELLQYNPRIVRASFHERLIASYRHLKYTKKQLKQEWSEGYGPGHITSLIALNVTVCDELLRLHAAFTQYLDRLHAEREPSETEPAAA